MFCPRCGRAMNENANFCGGCGLSRAEIEKYTQTVNTPAQPVAEPVVTAQPVEETPVAEPVVCEPVVTETPAEEVPVVETPVVEVPVVEAVAEEPKTETTYSYTAPEGAEYHYTAQTIPANSTTVEYTYAQPVTEPAQPAAVPAKKENLSTVDFIWMMLISAIPVVGIIYLIYLAIQNNNTNKRSYARATLIIGLFSLLVSAVFALGMVIAGLL